MPSKPSKPCSKAGCPNLTKTAYCEEHTKQVVQEQEQRRGTSTQRGYNYRWQMYSKSFLSRPENVFCKLQLPGCSNLAACVDHIDPNAEFWDKSNHQAACIHCNSVKGRRVKIGTAKPFSAG